MSSITITIPTAITQRVLDGFCANQGYMPILEDDSPNPESRAQFVKRKIIEYVKISVENSELQTARNNAASLAKEEIDATIILS